MGNELAAFGMEDAAKQLREKLKLAFTEMIPEEKWQELIEKEFESFIVSSRNQRSDLSILCTEVLREMAKERIKQIMSDEGWHDEGKWNMDTQREEINDRIKQLLLDNAPRLFEIMLENFFGSSFQTLMQQMQSRGY